MDIFDILSLLGGLSLFLFGMSLMGAALEKRAGGSLKTLLGKLTRKKFTGFFTGLGVTAVIQSSSATTVMVVGFVNSGLMRLRQAIPVIMGANVGTTVTAWILSLTGIESSNFFVSMLKPSSFTPILALIGILFYMSAKTNRRKDTGMILLGFSTLMFGMETMSSSISGLRDVPEFQNILLMFSNPIFGVLAGAVLTAIIQSSSASVGILQALATTGRVTFATAIPIIMGQNIGTCVTALLSSVGANKNAKRTAVVHLCFNLIGTTVWLTVFGLVRFLFRIPWLDAQADPFGIAVAHTVFNLLCTALLFPMDGLLEKLACKLISDAKTEELTPELDERLMATPAVAIARCRAVAETMAVISSLALKDALRILVDYDAKRAEAIREKEQKADHYEDILGTYLVKMGTRSLNDRDSAESAKLLHVIGDFERISDHAVHILEAAEELRDKGLCFSPTAKKELSTLTNAVWEIVELAIQSFQHNDLKTATLVAPLKQVIDLLRTQLRSRHILRMQQGLCSIEAGFVLSDLLTALEQVADLCSDIAGCVVEISRSSLGLHGYLQTRKQTSPEFLQQYTSYARKYALVQT